MYIYSDTVSTTLGIPMKKHYKHNFDYEPGKLVPYVHNQSCGVPDHSTPSHKLSMPVDSARQQGDTISRFSRIDVELATYFHPKYR